MKRPLTATFLLLFAPLSCPTATWGETLAAAAQNPEFHPAVTALFESKDPFVHKVVLPNIEANRKCDAVLTVVNGEGQPIAGAAISAVLKQHEFLFGHCDLATERDPERRTLLNEIFHFTCPGNVTKWRAYAKNPGINFISLHAHKPRQLWASPKDMYETYDPYLEVSLRQGIDGAVGDWRRHRGGQAGRG